jgi:hypothetical protein
MSSSLPAGVAVAAPRWHGVRAAGSQALRIGRARRHRHNDRRHCCATFWGDRSRKAAFDQTGTASSKRRSRVRQSQIRLRSTTCGQKVPAMRPALQTRPGFWLTTIPALRARSICESHVRRDHVKILDTAGNIRQQAAEREANSLNNGGQGWNRTIEPPTRGFSVLQILHPATQRNPPSPKTTY